MSEETGLGADAARTRETVLAAGVRVPAEADRRVVPALQAAYRSAVRGRQQLDAIGADIEAAVAKQRALALDTPAGAGTFSRFFDAKTQAVNRVVAETAAQSRAGAGTLGSLGPSYRAVGYGPKPLEPPPAPVPFPPYQPKVWDNDKFALYRRISLPDGRYAFTARVVVAASDGKLITAFPQTGG